MKTINVRYSDRELDKPRIQLLGKDYSLHTASILSIFSTYFVLKYATKLKIGSQITGIVLIQSL